MKEKGYGVASILAGVISFISAAIIYYASTNVASSVYATLKISVGSLCILLALASVYLSGRNKTLGKIGRLLSFVAITIFLLALLMES